MKEIFKYIIILLAMMPIASCVDDEKLFELDDFETGALPNLQRTDDDGGFIDFTNYESTYLEFTIDFSIVNSPDDDGFGKADPNTEYNDVASVQLEVLWQRSGQLAVSGELGTPITSWPTTVTITDVTDLVDAIPTLTDVDSIAVGDVFTFVCSITLADGRVLPAFVVDPAGNKTPGYSVNFSGTENNPGYDFSVSYAVSCSSNIPLGNYDGVTVGPLGTTSAVVEVTAGVLPGQYACDDLSAGMLGLLIDDLTYLGRGAFEDICNEITVPTFAPPGLVNVTQWAGNPGSYDPSTGVIILNWDIIGFQHTTTLTPQ